MYKKIQLIAIALLLCGIPNQSNALNNIQNNAQKKTKKLICKRTNPDNDLKITKSLLEAVMFIFGTMIFGPLCDQLPASQMQPLYDAIKNGDMAIFKTLYKQYCTIFVRSNMIKPDSNGQTLFEYAIEKRNGAAADLIIDSWQRNNRLFDTTNDKNKNNVFHRLFAMANKTSSKKETDFFSDRIKKLLNCTKSNHFYFEAKNNNGLTPIDIACEKKLEDALYQTILFIIQNKGPVFKADCEEFIIEQLAKAKKHGLWTLAAKLINYMPTVTLFESFYELVQQKSHESLFYFYKNLLDHGLKHNITIADGHEEERNIVEELKRGFLGKNLLAKAKQGATYTPKKPGLNNFGHDLKICFNK